MLDSSFRKSISNINGNKITPKSLILSIKEYAKEWVKRQTPEATKSEVFKMLDSSKHKLMSAAIGLRANGELDGYSTNNALKINITESANKAVKEWLDKSLIDLPELLNSVKFSDIKLEFMTKYRAVLIDRVKEIAKERANADAKTIVDMIGYDPDEITRLLRDLVPDDSENKPAVPALCGKTWAPKGILSSAVAQAIVKLNDDGTISDRNLDIPEFKAFCLVRITAGSVQSLDRIAYIITDGDIWYPIDLIGVTSDVQLTNLVRIIESGNVKISTEFKFREDYIFNMMNDLDGAMINMAIATFMQSLQKSF